MKKTLLITTLVVALGACVQKPLPQPAPLPEVRGGPALPRSSGPIVASPGSGQARTSLGQATAGGIPASATASPEAMPMTLNFADADIRQIAATILGDGLKVTYTIDPSVHGTATIRSERALPPAELLSALQSLLAQNGATLVVRDGLYRVTVATEAGSGPVVNRDDMGSGTVVITLNYASARDLAKVLEPFVGVGAKVVADSARNVLLVSGEPTARAGLLDLVATFDTDMLRNQSYAVLPVANGDATTAAGSLAQAMGAAGEGPLAGVVRIMALKRANAVLVVAPQAHFIDQARRLFAVADFGGTVTGRIWHVYFVQNGDVMDLERMLRRAFMGEAAGGASAQGGTAPGLEPVQISGSPFGGSGSGGGLGTSGSSGSPGPSPGGLGSEKGMGGGMAGGPEAGNALPEPPTALSGGAEPQGGGGGQEEGIRVIGNRNNSILLIYSNPREQEMVEAMLRKIDILPQQVRIDATIAEVTLNDTLKYGTQFYFQDGGFASTLSGVAAGSTTGSFPGFVLARALGSARFALSALQDITNVRVLSSPQIVAVDNQPAFLQVGDTVPYVTQTSVSTQNPDAPIVSSIQYRDTGVILQVTPRVNGNGLVSLDISQEVSDVVATKTSGIDSPTFPQRRIKSRVVVEDGQTIGMAGLIRDVNTEGNSGLPVLKDIPVLGSLFGTQNNVRARTELLVMITPHIIHDQRDARALTEDLRQTLQGPALVPQTLNRLKATGKSNPNAAVGAPTTAP